MGSDAENDGEIALQDFPKPRYARHGGFPSQNSQVTSA